MYADEAASARVSPTDFTPSKFTAGYLPGTNPLFDSPDPSQKLAATDDRAGNYFIFVPKPLVLSCLNSLTGGGPRTVGGGPRQPLKITLFFSPFGGNAQMFTFGLRSIFEQRANDQRVLISIPGNETRRGSVTTSSGVGISLTQINDLLASQAANYSSPQISVLAAWSAGWKGMVAMMRAIGRMSDLPMFDKVEQVIFYDCLYFTGGSSGLVDDALKKVQAEIAKSGSSRKLQVIAYLSTTPGGNDSLNPADIVAGIPTLRTLNAAQGLIPFSDATRTALTKIALVRVLAWALQEGAIAPTDLSQPLLRACTAIAGTNRIIRSMSSLPFAKGAPAGTIDLQTFARVGANAPILMLSPAEIEKARALVNDGRMIFTGTFPPSELDHMVLMPEIAWEFLAG